MPREILPRCFGGESHFNWNEALQRLVSAENAQEGAPPEGCVLLAPERGPEGLVLGEESIAGALGEEDSGCSGEGWSEGNQSTVGALAEDIYCDGEACSEAEYSQDHLE